MQNFLKKIKCFSTLSLGLLLIISKPLFSSPLNIHPEIEASDIAKELKRPPMPTLKSAQKDIITPPLSQNAIPKEAQKIMFVLKQINIKGNKAFDKKTLEKKFFKAYLNKKVNLTQMYELVDKITKFYREKGYVFSQAQVPDQTIEKGIFSIEVQEAYINTIEYNKNALITPFMQKIFIALKKLSPLNIKDLEYYLLLLNDLGGYSIRSSLIPNTHLNFKRQQGLSLYLEIKPKPNQGVLSINNYGSPYTSRNIFLAQYTMQNLLLKHSKLDLILSKAFNLKNISQVNLSYDKSINSEGTLFDINYNDTQVKLQKNFAALNVRSKFQEYSTGLKHKLIRTRSNNWSTGLKFAHRRNVLYALGEKLSDAKLDKLIWGNEFDFLDKYSGLNLVKIDFHQSVNGLTQRKRNRGPDKNPANLKPYLNKLTTYVIHAHALSEKIELYSFLNGQYTPFLMPSSEKLAYGGQSSGRGYNLSEMQGDSGLLGLVELGYKLLNSDKKNLKVYSSLDIGKTWNRGNVDAKNTTGSSLGLGLRGNLALLNYEFSLGHKLKKLKATDKKDVRVLFLMNYAL